MNTRQSPLWPNPAPTGPIKFVRRDPGTGQRDGSTTFRVDGAATTITITVIDGESLTDILNRVYALACQNMRDVVTQAGQELRGLTKAQSWGPNEELRLP